MIKEEVIKNMEKKIVENCMGDETPACVATCPMHTNVKEYVRLTKNRKWKRIYKSYKEKIFSYQVV